MERFLSEKNEFKKFVKRLDQESLTKEVKILINLILANFNRIAALGTAQGKRAQKLITSILKEHKNVSSSLNPEIDQEHQSSFPIQKLVSLKVSNFRGFRDIESKFSFDKKYTLVYGPNGSGKSSFCEALEYSLLGEMEEAKSMRMDEKQYGRNIDTGKFEVPELIGQTANSNKMEVRPNRELFNFAFIEKNRIQNFARISANPPNSQVEMLSILFGLSNFNEFVNDFTPNFHHQIEKYFSSGGSKVQELDQKKQEKERKEKNKKEYCQELRDLVKEKQRFLSQVEIEGINTLDELDTYISGNEEREGKIGELNSKLTSLPDEEYPKILVEELIVKIQEGLDNYLKVQADFNQKRDELSYRDLFKAVLNLQEYSDEKCPACRTPIDRTRVNPFKHAKNKLEDLKEVGKIEADKERIWREIKVHLEELLDKIRKAKSNAKDLNIAFNIKINKKIKPAILKEGQDSIDEIKSFLQNEKALTDNIEQLNKSIEEHNKEYSNSEKNREELNKQLELLNSYQKKIQKIRSKSENLVEQIKKAKRVIDEFEEENEELIKQANKEKVQRNLLEKYEKAYNSLLSQLEDYKNELPLRLVADLNELTKEFYNQINHFDEDFELIDRIELPTSQNDKISVSFKNEPEKKVDALRVLSEGHVRCLGLSILIAKNKIDEIPILIFDDVVNAIDDDHRSGLRNLIFENSLLTNKQIILTSHAEGFIKDLENQVPKQKHNKLVKNITFLRPKDERGIRISRNNTSHYVKRAIEALDLERKRNSLSFCRPALENMVDQIWKKMSRKHKMDMSIKVWGPRKYIHLMNLVQKMRKKLSKIDKEKFEQIIGILSSFEGLEKSHNQIWNYLNKGSHDDRDRKEFDRVKIKEIIGNLDLLNEEIQNI